MARIHTKEIFPTECLGDSLVKINSNDATLDAKVVSLSAELDVVNTQVISLSAVTTALQTVAPKAIVLFRIASLTLPAPTIIASDNVQSVSHISSDSEFAKYRITFTNAFTTTNYLPFLDSVRRDGKPSPASQTYEVKFGSSAAGEKTTTYIHVYCSLSSGENDVYEVSFMAL